MTDRELMQQALEALSDCTYDEEGYCLNPDNVDAILALRERLAQPEIELETYKRLYELRGKALERPCINCGHQPAKIKTMAQPEQGPVAWVYPEGLEALKSGRPWTAYGSSGGGRIPLYLNDAVARRAEPRESGSGAGFESLPASPNQPEQESPITHNHLWIGDLYGRERDT